MANLKICIKKVGQTNGHPFPQQETTNGFEAYWPTTPHNPPRQQNVKKNMYH
jgi:hypothetical protein